jgi:phosphoenolpyruvate carboxykinase (ATP)
MVLTGREIEARLRRRTRWNLPVEELVRSALAAGEGVLTRDGALAVATGTYTGRSPRDKFTVLAGDSAARIDWESRFNHPLPPEVAHPLVERVTDYAAAGHRLYGFHGYVGRGAHRVPICVINEFAWHNLMARHMFVRPEPGEPVPPPEFTLLYTPGFLAVPARDGTLSEAVILADLEQGAGIIGGTQYGGEEKKFFFYLMNYLMPLRGVMPMHCSANVGAAGDTSLLFGLSGTGKTTLSADPQRRLLGDDEHGWSAEGVFNFEGGCYAKLIRLSRSSEPVIWEAVNRPGSIMENVTLRDGVPDFAAGTIENTRGVYPIDAVPNGEPSGMAGHPKTVVYLTFDASGTLPPLSLLDENQALYWFLAGYTAKVAGTERGLGSKPEPTFSACFGAPFLPLPPARYVALMGGYLARYRPLVILLNTGMIGGAYGGGGRRPPIEATREMLRAAQSGALADAATDRHPVFGIRVPRGCPGLPPEVLNPALGWPGGKLAYQAAARELAAAFRVGVTGRYAGSVPAEVLAAGPGS